MALSKIFVEKHSFCQHFFLSSRNIWLMLPDDKIVLSQTGEFVLHKSRIAFSNASTEIRLDIVGSSQTIIEHQFPSIALFRNATGTLPVSLVAILRGILNDSSAVRHSSLVRFFL